MRFPRGLPRKAPLCRSIFLGKSARWSLYYLTLLRLISVIEWFVLQERAFLNIRRSANVPSGGGVPKKLAKNGTALT